MRRRALLALAINVYVNEGFLLSASWSADFHGGSGCSTGNPNSGGTPFSNVKIIHGKFNQTQKSSVNVTRTATKDVVKIMGTFSGTTVKGTFTESYHQHGHSCTTGPGKFKATKL